MLVSKSAEGFPHEARKKVVTVVYEWVPEYRELLYREIFEAFSRQGIDFRLVAGKPSSKYKGRSESLSRLDFKFTCRRLDLRLGSRRIAWTFLDRTTKASDLLIFEQARRNLEILPWLLRGKQARTPKIAVWGHGNDFTKTDRFSKAFLNFITARANALLLYKEVPGKTDSLFPITQVYEIGNSLYTSRQIQEIQSRQTQNLETKIVLYLGALSAEKKIEEFIDLAKLSLSRQLDWQFVIAGSGPIRDEIHSEKLENVVLAGAVNGEDKAELIAKATCLVIPDAIGLVAIDALVHSKVVFTKQDAKSHGPELEYLKNTGLLRTYTSVANLLEEIDNRRRLPEPEDAPSEIPSVESVARNFVKYCIEILES
jgi:glycosyltransferase involved in cell wall biosynthesis